MGTAISHLQLHSSAAAATERRCGASPACLPGAPAPAAAGVWACACVQDGADWQGDVPDLRLALAAIQQRQQQRAGCGPKVRCGLT